nr:hypothetical protein [Tanacetum cinerariifolium]
MVNPTIYTSCIEQFWATAKVKNINGKVQLHAKVYGKKVVISEASIRRDLQFEDEGGVDCLPNEVIFEQLALMRCQETIGDTSAHTRYERASKMSSDLLLAGVNTPRSDEDILKHIELMKIYTTLQKKVLDLEDDLKRTKIAQQTKIDGLEKKVKKLEKKQSSRTHKLKRLYKVSLTARVISSSDDEALDKEDTSKQEMINNIDVDEDITLVSTHDDVISAAETIVTTAPTITAESTKINVAVTQAPKRKGVMIQEPEETTTTKTASSQQHQVQDKEKEKVLAAKRAEEKRNKPPTKAQQRSLMCTYLKNMDGWKPRALENKSFAKIQELFDKAMKRINTFVDLRTELVEESIKKDEKVEDDKESEELKKCLENIPDDGDDVTIDGTPLYVKTLIVDYKIYKEWKKNYF